MRAICVFFCGAMILALASGCDGDDGGDCVAGVACFCDENCTQTCGGNGSSCSFECSNGANCTFNCPGGGCGVDANGAGSVNVTCGSTGGCQVDVANSDSATVSCSGNGCGVSCSGTDVCRITDCDFGCGLICGGATTCDSSCTPFDGGCATTP
jgi:hypothetical protein